MGSRRTNIIIVSVILAMLVGSIYVIATKPTKKGLDPERRHAAHLPGRAERRQPDDRRRGHRSRDRDHPRPRRRTRRLRARDRPARVGRDPDQPSERPGHAAGDPAGRRHGEALLLRPRAERGAARSEDVGRDAGEPQPAGDDQSLRRRRGRVQAGHQVRRQVHDDSASALPVREEEPPVRRRPRDHQAGSVLDRRGQGGAEGRPEDLHRSRRARSSSRTRRTPTTPTPRPPTSCSGTSRR